MPPTPPSRLSERLPLLALGLLACGGPPRAPTYATTDRWEPARRRPDGVALDPLPASVAPVSGGESPSPRPLALRPPLPVEAAVDLAQRTIEAMASEDQAALQGLVSAQGIWVNPLTRTSIPLLPHLRERIRRLDYPQLAGYPLVQERTTEVYTEDDLAAALPGRPQRPAEMRREDVLLRVRILTPRVGADRFFGDELLLLLRPEDGSYRVRWWQEEFQIP